MPITASSARSAPRHKALKPGHSKKPAIRQKCKKSFVNTSLRVARFPADGDNLLPSCHNPRNKGEKMAANQPTILIVDDTPENLSVLGELLQPTYRVRAANSGRRALQIAHGKPPPDLILLDVMMPEMDGYDVLAELRRRPGNPPHPGHLCHGDGRHRRMRNAASNCGAVDYITKPIRPSLIVLARVRTQLEIKRARDVLSRPEQLSGGRSRAPHG
jgi:CheY-like chemotaxis protein